MTKKSTISVLTLILSGGLLFAQASGRAGNPGETILQSYERNFVRASLSTKVNVLFDAGNDEEAGEFYGQLCELALRFVLDNAALFHDDPDMINITVTAIRGIGRYSFYSATELAWQVFLRFPDNVIRYEILEVLPELDLQSLTAKINDFILEQNRRYVPGMPVETELLLPLIAILGLHGDVSCYPVLFASSILYSGVLQEEAINTFYKIDGDVLDFCIGVIIGSTPEEKLAAFNLALNWEWIPEDERGGLAETALEVALSVPGDRRAEILELSEASLKIIEEEGWVRALPQVLKYYNQSVFVFRADPLLFKPLINAINCLGKLKSADAAQVLILHLGLYNSRCSELQKEELDVVLAMIHALGQLAYKASYDVLNYASLLPYPEQIIAAARDAAAKLDW